MTAFVDPAIILTHLFSRSSAVWPSASVGYVAAYVVVQGAKNIRTANKRIFMRWIILSPHLCVADNVKYVCYAFADAYYGNNRC